MLPAYARAVRCSLFRNVSNPTRFIVLHVNLRIAKVRVMPRCRDVLSESNGINALWNITNRTMKVQSFAALLAFEDR